MLKKRVLLGVLLAIFLLAGLTMPCAAQKIDGNPDLINEDVKESLTYEFHLCRIPYFINSGSWVTGIHIYTNQFGGDDFEVKFWSGGVNYAISTLHIDLAVGWTGIIQDLLLPGIDFQSPSMVSIQSEKARFFVTQFIFTEGGFTHQTFHSYPYAYPWWPYWYPEYPE